METALPQPPPAPPLGIAAKYLIFLLGLGNLLPKDCDLATIPKAATALQLQIKAEPKDNDVLGIEIEGNVQAPSKATHSSNLATCPSYPLVAPKEQGFAARNP